MLQNNGSLLTKLFLLTGCLIVFTYGQANFKSYSTVKSFTCNNPISLERIQLNKRCGILISPCYPNEYPEELGNGYKMWTIDANNGSKIPVVGYRFTLNTFSTDMIGGNLDFAVSVHFQRTTNLNLIQSRQRVLSISGMASEAPGARVRRSINGRRSRTREYVLKGGHFDIDQPKLFVNFYASRELSSTGFNITYCADYNKCDPNYSPPLCNSNRSRCVRHGFGNYSCVCNAGYSGANCDVDVNECLNSPCANNAVCRNLPGSYSCICASGYSGNGSTNCTDVNECVLGTNDCSKNNTSTCTNTIGSYKCACRNGYTGNGKTCNNIDECALSNLCHSDAVCIDGIGKAICRCKVGFTGNGSTCVDINECNTGANNCAKDGSATCTNSKGSYTCTCKAGYTGNGRNCKNINECQTEVCAQNALCTDTNGSYACACKPGYRGNGRLSCADINECTEGIHNCASRNTSLCTNIIGNFTCACKAGYTGNGRVCTNINECALSKPCHSNAQCKDTNGSYLCTCNNGYSGNGLRCQDVDECAKQLHTCAGNNFSICTNTNGSYACACKNGYTGDGRTCSNVNECSTKPCHKNAVCTDTIGSYKCACKLGFSGNGITCSDVNECSLKTDNCAKENSSICTNTNGSFTCACRKGFTGNGRNCSNVNECENNPCPANSRCIDTRGSYSCQCVVGYTIVNKQCHDINECMLETHKCAKNNSATCTNNNGSYTCSCNDGYTGNGRTCTNINECSTKPCHANAYCNDTVGSYTCTCNSGFRGNGKNCTDINECSESLHGCANGTATCTNLVGSHLCTCNSGYTGNGKTCSDINECANSLHNCAGNNTSTCTNVNGSFSCSCKIGYTGNGTVCTNINECSTRPCHSRATCVDTFGSFRCTCNPGYAGNGFSCRDVDECTLGTHTCAPHGVATCTNTNGSYVCTCKSGFIGNGKVCNNTNECLVNPCDKKAICFDIHGSYSCRCFTGYSGNGRTCSDINECLLGTHTCSANNTSICTNTNGSYSCSCKQGFSGNGRKCKNVNECLTKPCHANAYCNDTVGSYNCTCNSGFRGNGKNCTDINECQEKSNNCAGNNTATCTNIPGSFRCSCKSGFSGNGTYCQNINECSGNPCHKDASCQDMNGSYNCTCKTGYRGNGFNCTDINECLESLNECAKNNTSICRNTNGSYVCSCKSGYSGNGKKCSNINECSLPSSCTSNASCRDTDGSYVCTCNQGYTGNGFKQCSDVNECALGTSTCAGRNSATCTNTNGSYTCACKSGFSGDGRTCSNINECLQTDPCDKNAICRDLSGSYNCTCKSGYTGNGFRCTDINECRTSKPCDRHASCSNTNGSYVCSCLSGYTGNGKRCQDINECETSSICGASNLHQKCENLNGSYRCICDTPAYRGTPPNCRGYFCPGTLHNRRSVAVSFTRKTSCTIPGIIEWPNFYDGIKTYKTHQIISWFVDFRGYRGNYTGIKFTFLGLSVEKPEDYIIFSNSSSILSTRLAVFTGNLTSVYNNEKPASSSNPIGYDVKNKTYVIPRTSVYIYFYSDRKNVSTGFQMRYEPLQRTNNCPAINPCSNGGRCVSRLDSYFCVGCARGYTGRLCSKDVDECAKGIHTCNANAKCTNTIGSYNCSCLSSFTGNGRNCIPLIVFSNLQVTTYNNRTNSFLRISFNVSDPWGKNASFIPNYMVSINETSTKEVQQHPTLAVNSTMFLPFIISVVPYTKYQIDLNPGERNAGSTPQFSSTKMISPVTIVSSSILPLVPTTLNIVKITEDFVNVSWQAPLERARGKTVAYEFSYKQNQKKCLLYQSLDLTVNCSTETTLRVPSTSQSHLLTKLLYFRYYRIRIRAYTVVGHGPWTSYVEFFTGTTCPPQTNQVIANSRPCNKTSAALISKNFPESYPSFETSYWVIQIPKNQAIRIHIDYLDIEKNQDYLDVGQGKFPDRAISTNNRNVITLTGKRSPRSSSLNYTRNNVNKGFVFVRFNADLFNKEHLHGFLIHYETNSSKCLPSNPCQNGGTCVSTDFDFTCVCSSLWTGKTCESHLIRINASWSSPTSSSVIVSWTTTPQWKNDISAILKYRLSFGNSSVIIPSNAFKYTIRSLTPYQVVVVTIEAISGNPFVRNASTTVRCQTREAIPKPPQYINATSTSSDRILVNWKPAAPTNGLITGYLLTYKQEDAFIYNETQRAGNYTVPGTKRLITGLRPYRRYLLTVSVINNVGRGPSLNTSATTLPSSPTGRVSHVTVRPEAREATLTIVMPNHVTGNFTYDVIYEIKGGSQNTIIGVPSVYTLLHLTPFSSYSVKIYPRSAHIRGNESLEIDFDTKQDTPGPAVQLLPNYVSSTGLILTWKPPTETNGIIIGYRVQWVEAKKNKSSSSLSSNVTSYKITGLLPYTEYTFKVYPKTSSGEGKVPGTLKTRTASTIATHVRNLRVSLNENNTITITFDQPFPLNGKLEDYQIQITQNESESKSLGDRILYSKRYVIPACIRGFYVSVVLPAYRSYSVAVAAKTCAGIGRFTAAVIRTHATEPGVVRNVQVISTGLTTARVTWSAPEPITGDLTYTVRASANSGIIISRILKSNAVNQTMTLNGLISSEGYTVTVSASTGIGRNSVSKPVTLQKTPSLLSEARVAPYTGSRNNLGGADPSTAHAIENPCKRKAKLFSEKTGAVTSINVIVKQNSAAPSTKLGVWATAVLQRPIPPYITGKIQCSSPRSKRAVMTDGNGYVIGSDTKCNASSTSVCNGPLVPGRTYQVAYQANGAGGSSQITPYGGDFYMRQKSTSGLTAGEIAAIVACLILVFFLIVLCIIFCLRKRSSSRSTHAQLKQEKTPNHKENPMLDIELTPKDEENPYKSSSAVGLKTK